jgi:hypothetical protein
MAAMSINRTWGVKLQFLGNNSKTVNKNRNLTRGKND